MRDDDLRRTKPEPHVSSPPSRAPVPIGTTIAEKYVVDGVLGSGGMGVVVSARHLELDQRVALKFLGPDSMAQPEAVERLLREAKAAARLRSEHVVHVLDVGRLASGTPYIVMEYVEGRDLGQILQEQGPLPVDVAIDYVLQACVGLAEAHTAGIVHRDLKPANLLLTQRRDGRPLIKLLDFGISKIEQSGAQSARTTGASLALGTPMYMSPEQMKSSRDVDQRTDVWALGMVLYELLSGRTAFQAETLPEICAKVLSSIPPPPLASVMEDAPETLDAVLLRALAKNPDQRWRNVAEFAQALSPFASAVGKGHVERAVKTFRTSGTFVPSLLPPMPPLPPPRISYLDETRSALELSAPAPSHVRGRRLAASVVAALLGALVAVGLVGLLLGRRTSPPTPSVSAGSQGTRAPAEAEGAPRATPPTPSVVRILEAPSGTVPLVSVGELPPTPPPSPPRRAPSPPATPRTADPPPQKPTPPAPPGPPPDDFGGRK